MRASLYCTRRQRYAHCAPPNSTILERVKRNRGIRFKGQIYDSPTGATKDIIEKGAVNDWNFWKLKNKEGKLVKLKEPRK